MPFKKPRGMAGFRACGWMVLPVPSEMEKLGTYGCIARAVHIERERTGMLPVAINWLRNGNRAETGLMPAQKPVPIGNIAVFDIEWPVTRERRAAKEPGIGHAGAHQRDPWSE